LLHNSGKAEKVALAFDQLFASMGVGRIFSRGGARSGFSRSNQKYISRGDESGCITFYLLETKKTNFLLKISEENVKFQNLEGAPHSDTHVRKFYVLKEYYKYSDHTSFKETMEKFGHRTFTGVNYGFIQIMVQNY